MKYLLIKTSLVCGNKHGIKYRYADFKIFNQL